MVSLSINTVLQSLIRKTIEDLGIQTFVETGTHNGKTALWASKIFKEVFTIDTSMRRITGLEAVAPNNVHAFCGLSIHKLHAIFQYLLEEPALLWLDAHSAHVRPPILEEIALVREDSPEHVIFVDDMPIFARGTYPEWPTEQEVVDALEGCALAKIAGALVAYPLEHASWLEAAEKRGR